MRETLRVPIKKYVIVLVLISLLIPFAMAKGDTVGGGAEAVLAPGETFDTNTCVECHSDSSKVEDTAAADAWKDSVHAEADIGCERCHSASVPTGLLSALGVFGGSYRDDHIDLMLDPDIDYKAPSAFAIEGATGEYSLAVQGGLEKQQAVAVCARCHGLTPIDPDSPKDVFADYVKDAHGASVIIKGLADPIRAAELGVEVTGDIDAATCADCHDVHGTKSKDDESALSHKDNVVNTCSKDACHGDDDISQKYEIVNALDTYSDTHHAKVLKLGSDNTARCPDCHGAGHNILATDNPEASVHQDNIAETCGQEDCHTGDLTIGAGSMHGKDRDTTIGSLIDLFYNVVIGVVVVFFVLYVILDFTLLAGKGGK